MKTAYLLPTHCDIYLNINSFSAYFYFDDLSVNDVLGASQNRLIYKRRITILSIDSIYNTYLENFCITSFCCNIYL